jgi:hypothetical protein
MVEAIRDTPDLVFEIEVTDQLDTFFTAIGCGDKVCF